MSEEGNTHQKDTAAGAKAQCHLHCIFDMNLREFSHGRATAGQIPPPYSRAEENARFPALAGNGVSFFMIDMQPGALRVPHWHPTSLTQCLSKARIPMMCHSALT
ncbi:MAG: hypothetical protein DMG65_03490 [Candidatus Angelobacter sp. Gp1-AA117]|nr:MAG: hypothetical protein DMG65_03490 [Candidatus Angelobacter sp. Gp1-AA117]